MNRKVNEDGKAVETDEDHEKADTDRESQ